jgi:hypothetical protein
MLAYRANTYYLFLLNEHGHERNKQRNLCKERVQFVIFFYSKAYVLLNGMRRGNK